MVQRKYTVLIIGCGNIGAMNDIPGSGNEHKTISYAKALKEHEAFEVFLYDKDIDKAADCSRIWGFKHDSGGNDNFDLIIIATPDETHYEWLNKIIKWFEKPRLVICEKPLCSTVAEAKEIIKLYEEAGIPILVDYTRRFIPEYQELHKHGVAVAGYCKYNRGDLHTGTHAIDTFRMFNTPIDWMCLSKSNEPDRYWYLKLMFQDGYTFTEQRIGDEPVADYFDHHTRYVIDNAYGFLEGKEELKCTAEDGLKALEIMERLCE